MSVELSFLEFLDQWYSKLPAITLKSLLKKIPPEQTAIFCVDLVNGFCNKGNLASPRVGAIVQPVVELFKNAEKQGINHYILSQDTHPEDSLEFEIYSPHCVEGSEESKTVKELAELPNAYKFKTLPKRNINPGLESNLQKWLEENAEIRQFIVVGDCTDICIHQLALHLKLRAIVKGESSTIVVPANCVDTFDIPVDAYKPDKVFPHPGDLMHRFFLYHMHLNGIQVVSEIK